MKLSVEKCRNWPYILTEMSGKICHLKLTLDIDLLGTVN